MDYGFQRPNLATPLSLALGLPQHEWERTHLAQLNKVSENFWLKSVDRDAERAAGYVWRVVDAWVYNEDSMMTRFWCYGPDWESIAHPRILVTWSSGQNEPIDGQFMTQNTGGYLAQVRSRWPSEAFAFGHIVRHNKNKVAHNCLVICWRLMPKREYFTKQVEGSIR